MSQCAIIGVPESDEVEWLDMRLEERGVGRVLLDASSEPAIELNGDHIRAQGKDLSKLRSVFVRDLGLRSPQVKAKDGRLDPGPSERALRESREGLASWNLLLEVLGSRGVRVVNPVATHEIHALKPWESAAHAAAGALVPSTLTCTPQVDMAATLAAEHSGCTTGWIRKGLLGGRGYTESFDPQSFDPESGAPDAAPERSGAMLVQERIEGVNVRAYVVGMRVIGAAAIHTLDGAETDSRRGPTRVQKFKLPPEAERAAVEATSRLGMLFSAVDFMRDDARAKLVLLECNSSPFFVNFEQMTGLPVTSALADLLVDKGPAFLERPPPPNGTPPLR